MMTEKYKSALKDLRINENFNENTLNFLKERLSEKNKAKVERNKWIRRYAVAAAAVLAVILCISIFENGSYIAMERSTGRVSVKYVEKAGGVSETGQLAALTEDEIFSKFHTSIFKGSVENIQNIRVKIGAAEHYWAIITVKIDEVYRGDEKAGDRVKILAECPIADGSTKEPPAAWVEDTGVISSVKIGMEGIFMPVEYDGDSKMTSDKGRDVLYMKDISDYGLPDGERFAFLQTSQGLVYSKDTYTSLSEASDLNDVKDYILQEISK